MMDQHTATGKIVTEQAAESSGLFPDGVRRALAGALIAASAFFGGCRSQEDLLSEIRSLPQPTPTEIMQKQDFYTGVKVALQGTPREVRDESYTTTHSRPIVTMVGKTPITTTSTSTTTHTQVWYVMADPTGESAGVSIKADWRLSPDTLMVTGKMVRDEQGNFYMEAEHSLKLAPDH